MIEVAHLHKRYGSFVAVEDLSFIVKPGEVLGLVGPNGAGKTSTLRSIAGIIPASEGTITIAGHKLDVNPVPAKQELAFFPDEPRLFEYLSVRQHLIFVATIYGAKDYESKIEALLEEFEIADKADKLPAELSRGMKQKLAIACGLIHDPKVLFFDEPLTGLDPLGIRRMKNSIIKRAEEGSAIILSSHLIDLVEEISSHVLILKQGKEVGYGSLNEIRALFSNGENDLDLEEIFIRATANSER